MWSLFNRFVGVRAQEEELPNGQFESFKLQVECERLEDFDTHAEHSAGAAFEVTGVRRAIVVADHTKYQLDCGELSFEVTDFDILDSRVTGTGKITASLVQEVYSSEVDIEIEKEGVVRINVNVRGPVEVESSRSGGSVYIHVS